MKEKKGPFAKELTEYLKENIEYYKQQIDAKTD
jgi:hypothetical protein